MFGIPLHKLIIHFPIALTVVALIYDLWASYSKRPEFHDVAHGLSMWAAFMALIAVVTGLQLASAMGLMRVATGHAGLGLASSIVLVGLGFWRYSARASDEHEPDYHPVGWTVLQILAAVLVLATAITGHRL